VLEVFAEAARLGRSKKVRSPRLSGEERRRFAWRPHKKVVVHRYWYVPVFQVEAAPVVRRSCERCGAVIELRAGTCRWQHISPYGVCR
jgi:hypothetical protein